MEAQQYWHAIQARVCTKCVDGDGRGNCRINPALDCPLKTYLPLIVSAVERVSSTSVEDYVKELRGIVCAQCAHQSASAKCALRDGLECALDRYFPLVIEAIEELKTAGVGSRS